MPNFFFALQKKDEKIFRNFTSHNPSQSQQRINLFSTQDYIYMTKYFKRKTFATPPVVKMTQLQADERIKAERIELLAAERQSWNSSTHPHGQQCSCSSAKHFGHDDLLLFWSAPSSDFSSSEISWAWKNRCIRAVPLDIRYPTDQSDFGSTPLDTSLITKRA